jgi:hypothetical protein
MQEYIISLRNDILFPRGILFLVLQFAEVLRVEV